MTGLISFFIVLLAGVFFSELFQRFHLPWVVALIFGGVLIGPFGLDFVRTNEVLSFFGEIGLIFLMFMAGLESRLSSFRTFRRNILSISFFNAGLPFLVGISIGLFFGFAMVPSLLIGIIFISSSIAVVIPSLEAAGLLRTRIGKIIVDSTMVQDILSLILLSLVFQSTAPTANIPLPLFYLILFLVLFALRWIIIKMQKFSNFLAHHDRSRQMQHELRLIFVIILGTVASFQLLGLHPIIGAFFAGLILSETITQRGTKEKIQAISYGLFIPVFFVVVGIQTDLSVLVGTNQALLLAVVIVIGSIASKFIGGWIGARISGIESRDAALVGVASTPQLSTTLAVVFAGFQSGLLSQELVTAMVILSAATTFFGPFLIRIFAQKKQTEALTLIEERKL